MATMYRQQLSQAPEPAVASPAAIQQAAMAQARAAESLDRKSTRLNSSHT